MAAAPALLRCVSPDSNATPLVGSQECLSDYGRSRKATPVQELEPPATSPPAAPTIPPQRQPQEQLQQLQPQEQPQPPPERREPPHPLLLRSQLEALQIQSLQVLGKGSYGTVLTIDNRADLVAKQIKAVNDIRHEVAVLELARQHRKPNIVKYFGYIQYPAYSFIIFERAIPFTPDIAATFTPEERARAIQQLAASIFFLHEQNYMHRDVKTNNLLWNDRRREILLSDFGCARPIPAKSSPHCSSIHLTLPICTPGYDAPEHMIGFEQYTEACDVWSMGCIVHEWLLQAPLLDLDTVHPIQCAFSRLIGVCKAFGKPTSSNIPSCWPEDAFDSVPSLARPSWRLNPAQHPSADIDPTQLALSWMLDCLQIHPDKRPSLATWRHHPAMCVTRVSKISRESIEEVRQRQRAAEESLANYLHQLRDEGLLASSAFRTVELVFGVERLSLLHPVLQNMQREKEAELKVALRRATLPPPRDVVAPEPPPPPAPLAPASGPPYIIFLLGRIRPNTHDDWCLQLRARHHTVYTGDSFRRKTFPHASTTTIHVILGDRSPPEHIVRSTLQLHFTKIRFPPVSWLSDLLQ